ncbi:unnamed protein product [Miscanthus lutarioriparius]|uniref:F-box domain-containing protein n=1 Tax=Miscanthus lutarioriparius TaxID=422564 RepID=A0A811REK0_9POAL|nr:unnamed protein product [Miscanthus lutarioriparius]
MASSSDGQGRRVKPVRAATSIGVGALPLDTLYDILLRLPAKELCRLRLVCRSWRALLSDPAFAAAHAARYPEPLILVGHNNNPLLDSENGDWKYQGVISVMDLSGHVVKKLRVDGHITSMSLHLACVKKTGDGSCRLVNPATGAVHHVPREDPVYGYSDRLCPFGQVASTREYKVLRKVSYSLNGNSRVLYEICTIVGRSSAVHGQAQWRMIQDPPCCIDIDWCAKASVVIDGVVYFLSKNAYSAGGSEQDWIASFDLETERWRPNIRGPQGLIIYNGLVVDKKLSLVNLNGSLVIVHLPYLCMDLWYLFDSDKGLWVRQYSIPIKEYYHRSISSSFTPLIVLDDGRIVIHIDGLGLGMLKIYDPKTTSCRALRRRVSAVQLVCTQEEPC